MTPFTPKRILVLGGTFLLGPAFVESAIADGHTVTLFGRGVTNPGRFPYLEHLRGFRSGDPKDNDLSALERRSFDVVVDMGRPADHPSIASAAAEMLKDRVHHYLYVSSIAAYDSKEYERAGIEEDASLEPWDGSAGLYKRVKAESERRLGAILGEKLTVVRPGPIKGRFDPSSDLLAWLVRAQHGGRHIAPGEGHDSVEIVDVMDVARFLVLAIDRPLYGTFNLTGRPMSFREFLDACKEVTRSTADFVWIPQDFLRDQGLETDDALGLSPGYFPFWRPAGAAPGLYQISSEKAYRAGWQTRPFWETALDCLTFCRTPGNLEWSDYLSVAKEKQVLEAWDQRRR